MPCSIQELSSTYYSTVHSPISIFIRLRESLVLKLDESARLWNVLEGAVQTLPPIAFLAGGRALAQSVDALLRVPRHTRFVFNLGHGLVTGIRVEHVGGRMARMRAAR